MGRNSLKYKLPASEKVIQLFFENEHNFTGRAVSLSIGPILWKKN
ncbi:hypothetical protein [Bacillus xiapuensis]|nr:hypothetical protein [Bacillus xiapuensis]